MTAKKKNLGSSALMPESLASDLKTYQEWQAEGMQVQRGQQSLTRIQGKPVFSREQCEPMEYDDEEERCKDAAFGFDGW